MNKKGFTLVELLGVIIILAIVLLIAVPNIMTLVERTKKDGYINDAKKMVYLVKAEIKKGGINKPATDDVVKVTLKDLLTKDLEKDKDGYTYDLEKSYVYITRENGNLVYHVQLVSDKGEKYRGILLINVEDLTNPGRYEKYYENTDVPDDVLPNDKYANKEYNVSIALNNVEASVNKLTMKYNGVSTVTVTPKLGYYLETVKCTNGYTTNAEVGITAMNAQTITIWNNSHDYPSVCTFTGKKVVYSADIDLVDTQASKENVELKYGGTATLDITPYNGYFLTSVSCTNGYTTNAEVGLSKTGKQAVTISNNNSRNLSVCKFKSLPAYPVVNGGSTTWSTASKTFTVEKPVPSSDVVRYEYYVSNSATKPSNTVSPSGSFTSKSVSIGASGKYVFFRVIYANGITSNWCDAKNLYVDSDALSPPTVTGEGTVWKLSRMFTVTGPNPISSISRYEYYVSNSTAVPAKTQTPTVSLTVPSMRITTLGQYVYFRVVNNAGVTSDWTTAKNLYVDPNTYTITYNPNGGVLSSEAHSRVKFNVETAYNLPTATKRGYELDKGSWYENSALTGTPINKIGLQTRGNKGLYAKWNLVTCNITYDLEKGTQASNPPTQYTIETPTFNLPKPTKTGYDFVSWDSLNGEGRLSQIVKGSTCNKAVLRAIWNAHSYTVVFNANGGTGTMANQSFKYDEHKNLRANSFQRRGYRLLGWSTSSTATTPTYDDKAMVANLSSTNNATVNLYAVWQRITASMLYYTNSNSSSCTTEAKSHSQCALDELSKCKEDGAQVSCKSLRNK